MFRILLVAMVLLSSGLSKNWEYQDKYLSSTCFVHGWISGDNYKEFADRNKIDRAKFFEFPGLFYGNEIKKYEIKAFGGEIFLRKNINECLIDKKPDSWLKVGEDYEVLLNILEFIPTKYCNKLAPNINSKCEKLAYIHIKEDTGGSLRPDYYVISGQFKMNGQRYIMPLAEFYSEAEGYDFIKKLMKNESKKKDLVTSGENILLETSHIIEQDKLILTVRSKNLVENGKGGISISFPQFSDTKRVIKKEKIGFDDVALYKKGKKIWNREIRKTVKNPYLLTEGWSNKWRAGEEKIIKLTIDTKNLDNLEVHVRSNVINGKKEYVNPTNSTFYNKQGYYDKILDLSLR